MTKISWAETNILGKSTVELSPTLGCKDQLVSSSDFQQKSMASEIRLEAFEAPPFGTRPGLWLKQRRKTIGDRRNPWTPHDPEYSMHRQAADVCYWLWPGIRVVRRYQAEFGLSYRKMTLYLLFFSVLAVSHWLACTLGIVHKFEMESFGRDWMFSFQCFFHHPSQEIYHDPLQVSTAKIAALGCNLS